MNALIGRLARALLALVFGLAFWKGVVWFTEVPHFILPSPERVGARLWDARELIAQNALVTFGEIIAGFVLGAALGVSTAMNMALYSGYRILMRPLIVFAQAIPIFALAPVITLWLGYGVASKIIVVVLIIYFPVASAFFDGLSRTPQGVLDLAHVMGASERNILLRIRAPYAVPALATGLRLAAAAAPFGAVIGEWVGASKGLGHLMLLANGRAQTDLMFAALIALATFSSLLYFAVDALGARFARRYSDPVA